jgi:ABC-type xylose transport system permease subunit
MNYAEGIIYKSKILIFLVVILSLTLLLVYLLPWLIGCLTGAWINYMDIPSSNFGSCIEPGRLGP